MTRPTSVAARRETVVRAGHRRDHVVGSRCKATDEGQYFQREQLFMRHFEFYSVLQALRRTAEMAVARGFRDQEKDEKRFRMRSMYSSRGDALRLSRGDPSGSES